MGWFPQQLYRGEKQIISLLQNDSGWHISEPNYKYLRLVVCQPVTHAFRQPAL